MPRRSGSARDRGFALLLVLWVVAILSVVVAGFAAGTRSESRLARNLLDAADARALAEAGVARAGASTFGLTNGTTPGVPAAVVPGFNYAFLAGGVNVVLSALSAVTDVDVVSAPQVVVLDHQQAVLQVGAEVPILTAQVQQTVTSGAPVVNSVSYVSTGVILHVRPQVNQNGVITLDISQEVSDVSVTTSSALGSPTINQRLVQTTASVLDGQTVALGGLITENRTLSNSGVPLLKDVPIFGSLFGTKQNQKGRTELLVLISPRVLHDAGEARSATEELRNRLHTIAPLVGRVH